MDFSRFSRSYVYYEREYWYFFLFLSLLIFITIGWNVTAQKYNFNVDGLQYGDYLQWVPCEAILVSDVLVSPSIADFIFTVAIAAPTATDLCGGILGVNGFAGACPIGSPFQEYNNFTDCLSFYSGLPQQTFCPFPLRGNTSTCRSLHLFAAFNVPSVHCPHGNSYQDNNLIV